MFIKASYEKVLNRIYRIHKFNMAGIIKEDLANTAHSSRQNNQCLSNENLNKPLGSNHLSHAGIEMGKLFKNINFYYFK